MSPKLVYWFNEIGKEYNDAVGKKCANLGEMFRLGLPVPPGFAICIDAYEKFLQETGAGEEISRYLSGLGQLQGATIARFEEISRDIRSMIEIKPMQKSLETEISFHYEELCQRVGISDVQVSVRSAGIESRPGMFDTYLNVRGKEEVLHKVKKVWSSTYTPRVIGYRVNRGIPLDADALGVAVPKMVNARAAGVCFTAHPSTGDRSKIVFECSWGIGESIVQGAVTPDRYVINKDTLKIEEKKTGLKTKEIVLGEKGIQEVEVLPDKQNIPCLTDEEVVRLAELAKVLELHYGTSQDVEWAVDRDLPFPTNLFLLQTRPAKTALAKKNTTDQIIDLLFRK
jgi:pyruvate,water dikinase